MKYPWVYTSTGSHSKKWGAYPEDQADFAWARQKVGKERTLEAELMNFADDVAYSIHDAEDFYRAGLIPMELLTTGGGEFDEVVRTFASKHPTIDKPEQVAQAALPFMN